MERRPRLPSPARSGPCRAMPGVAPGGRMNIRYSSMQRAGSCCIFNAMAMTKSIELRTEVPGPKSREIVERKERVIAAPLSLVHPIVTAEGRGATLTDVDGNTFIDFTGGVGCLNVGHSHPKVVEAAQEQLSRFAHTDFTIIP